MEEIFKLLEFLKNCYTDLSKRNISYYRKNGGIEEFQKLVDERYIAIDKSENIISELRLILSKSNENIDFSSKNLLDILDFVSKDEKFFKMAQSVKDSLNELVETDKLVSKQVNALQAKIKDDIAKTRTNARSIEGYKQLDTYGSCFINKVK